MTKSPKTITARKLAAEALHLMESNKPHPITVLPVVDEEKKVGRPAPYDRSCACREWYK